MQKWDDKRGRIFHNILAKLLWMCKRARPNIQTAVSFLMTQVRDLDEDDWKNVISRKYEIVMQKLP